jgi:hypothetical protein
MAFRQVCWLAERFWPDVDGIGDDEDANDAGSRRAVRQMRLQGAAAAAAAASSSSSSSGPASVGRGGEAQAGAGAGRGGDANGGGEDDGEPGEDRPESPFDAVMNGAQDMATVA